MSFLCFELSMPSVNSWNGRWSGEDNFYAVLRSVGRSNKDRVKADNILSIGSFRYDFEDGWAACVSVREIDTKEASKVIKKSKGFCGYEWMVNSIMLHGEIVIKK